MLMKPIAMVFALALTLGFSASLNAMPLSGLTNAADTKTQVIKVGSRYRSHKTAHRGHYTEYGYVQNRHVHAPGTHVTTSSSHVEVDVPYAYVKRTRRSITVRAPFVDIRIPR